MFYHAAARLGIGAAAVLLLVSLLAGCGVTDKGASSPQAAVNDEQQRKLETFNRAAEDMYDKVNAGDIVAARNRLIQLGDLMTGIRFEGIASIEGVDALTDSIVSAKRVFNAVQFSMKDGKVAAAKIRLAADALTHANEPMWLQYYKVLNEDMKSLRSAATDKNAAKAKDAFDRMREHYQIIRPSVLINREPWQVEKADSLFAFMEKQLADAKYDRMESGIAEFDALWRDLFMKRDAAAYVPIVEGKKPVGWSLGIGTVIFCALVYVAWRKFRYGRDYVIVPKQPPKGQ